MGSSCAAKMTAVSATIFLLSPAKLSGKRGQMLLNPDGKSRLAQRLRSEGATVGEVFSFVSGLYFRGKVAYAKAFGCAPATVPSGYVITAGGGLLELDELVDAERLKGWRDVSISENNPHFTAPLLRHASQLLDRHDDDARFVLLGSVASNKYVTPLSDIFAERLLFPAAFAGLGDMSRGALMLRAVREQRELEYAPLATL